MSDSKQDRQKRLDALLGRALRDKAFRDRLIANPAEAAKESGLTADELELVAGGLAIGTSLVNPGNVMFCTEKTCNEKGGARVVVWSPDPTITPSVTIQTNPPRENPPSPGAAQEKGTGEQ
jgi:hypothetical protein